MKKGVTITIIILVFVVLAVVTWLFISSNNKDGGVITRTTESSGISNLLGSINPQTIGALLTAATTGGIGGGR